METAAAIRRADMCCGLKMVYSVQFTVKSLSCILKTYKKSLV